MPRKQRHVVRIAGTRTETGGSDFGMLDLSSLLECLRYAGIITVVADDETKFVFDLKCPDPREIDSTVWARQNAARIRSFGINAVMAPEIGG